jgi:adenine phosphoribosyltransferase
MAPNNYSNQILDLKIGTKEWFDQCYQESILEAKALIREVQFKGVNFYDITPLLADMNTFDWVINNLDARGADLIISPESRGFIFGSALAYAYGCGFTVARKKGALPVVSATYAYNLEYGAAVLEIPSLNWDNYSNIVFVDDVLATGGSALAVSKLLQCVGKKISKYVFFIELTGLNGRDKLDAPVESLLQY